MKKCLGILVTLLLVLACVPALADVPIDSAHFPDPGFQEILKTWYDKDKNGVLSDQELAVTTMNLGPQKLVITHGDGSQEKYETIGNTVSSIEGIQYFPNITDLILRSQLFPVVDVSSIGTLTNLEVNYIDSLTSVTGPSGLVRLRCDHSSISSLDVSRYPDL